MPNDHTDHPLAITISIPKQILTLWIDGEVAKSYPISSSKFGLGFEEGSFRTPTGRFHIAGKIGGDQPLWMTFKARQPTGNLGTTGGDEDLILTRILRLHGMDPENQNTYDRYIYIHGTNQEDRIGQPASHGCIRMKNADIVELFAQVSEGTPVVIEA